MPREHISSVPEVEKIPGNRASSRCSVQEKKVSSTG